MSVKEGITYNVNYMTEKVQNWKEKSGIYINLIFPLIVMFIGILIFFTHWGFTLRVLVGGAILTIGVISFVTMAAKIKPKIAQKEEQTENQPLPDNLPETD